MTGTSQATAFVSGAAALVMAHKQIYDPEWVKKYILSTGDAQSQLASKTRTSRQLNLYKALTILDQGVSATGVVAVNTRTMKKFNSQDPNDVTGDEGVDTKAAQMSAFGRSLLNAMDRGLDKKKVSPSRMGSKNGSGEL